MTGQCECGSLLSEAGSLCLSTRMDYMGYSKWHSIILASVIGAARLLTFLRLGELASLCAAFSSRQMETTLPPWVTVKMQEVIYYVHVCGLDMPRYMCGVRGELIEVDFLYRVGSGHHT